MLPFSFLLVCLFDFQFVFLHCCYGEYLSPMGYRKAPLRLLRPVFSRYVSGCDRYNYVDTLLKKEPQSIVPGRLYVYLNEISRINKHPFAKCE